MFFALSLRGGGAERVLINLANEMSKNNDVTITTVHRDMDYYGVAEKVKTFCLDNKRMNPEASFSNKFKKLSARRLIALSEIIKKEKPDVIITFLPLPSLYITLLKRVTNVLDSVPIILSERGDPNKEYDNKIIRILAKRLYRQADGFVFQTEDAKSFFCESIDCEAAIIENPINETFFKYNIPKKRKKVVVSCGRLENQKNYRLLIKSFADVVREYPEFELNIYGEGGKRNELLDYAKELCVAEKVHLMGRVSNIVENIIDAKVFVLSSDYEGMPNALMEAMALGIPCISTDCPVGGPRTLIKDGENGLLVKVGNEKQLSDAIVRVITDNNLAAKLSENGASEAKKYTAENIVKKWEEYIMRVVSKNG